MDYLSIYGKSSSQLTNSIIFQRGGSTTNQEKNWIVATIDELILLGGVIKIENTRIFQDIQKLIVHMPNFSMLGSLHADIRHTCPPNIGILTNSKGMGMYRLGGSKLWICFFLGQNSGFSWFSEQTAFKSCRLKNLPDKMIPHRFILPILPWSCSPEDDRWSSTPSCFFRDGEKQWMTWATEKTLFVLLVSHDIRYPVSSQYSVSSMPTVFLGVSTIPMLFTYTILHNDVAVIKLFDICPMFLFHWRWRQNYDTVIPLYIYNIYI